MVFNMSVTVLLALVAIVPLSSPKPEPQPFASVATTPNIESALTAIEERLRALDNVYSFRFAASRWELIVESQNRKLESLESKISRIETLLELRMDKLTESMNSKNLKDELSKDQLGRKMDIIYERLNHRMSYMESRIENNINKMQTTLDTTLNRISSQLEHFEKSNSEIETDILEISSNIEEAKSMMINFNTSMSSNQQNDGFFKNVSDETIKKMERNIVNQFNSLATKLSDMYNGMSQSSRNSEDLIRKSLDLFNVTKKELQEGVQSLKSYRKHPCQSDTDESIDYLIEKMDTLTRKNDQNYQRLDHTIERLHEKQELYQESCHRLQLKEPQIENRIGEILEKMLDFIGNRTQTADKNYETILDRLKSHHAHVLRNVGQTTSMVAKLTEQVANDFKVLYNDITTNNPTSDKIDMIIMGLQELHDQFLELNFTLTHPNLFPVALQNQPDKNTTAVVLNLLQTLSEKINVIIDKLNEDYRSFSDNFDGDEKYNKSWDHVSKNILSIFNMTEDDLKKLNESTPAKPESEEIDETSKISWFGGNQAQGKSSNHKGDIMKLKQSNSDVDFVNNGEVLQGDESNSEDNEDLIDLSED